MVSRANTDVRLQEHLIHYLRNMMTRNSAEERILCRFSFCEIAAVNPADELDHMDILADDYDEAYERIQNRMDELYDLIDDKEAELSRIQKQKCYIYIRVSTSMQVDGWDFNLEGAFQGGSANRLT